MKRHILICIAVLMMAGCCVLPEAIPPSERKGRLYWYTRNAFEGEGHRVRLVGWPLEFLLSHSVNNNSGSWPNPGPVELLFALSMVPVMMVDSLVVTPAIDTVFVPYDLCQKYELQSRYDVCRRRIVMTPESILSIPIEFYPADEQNTYLSGRLKRTPEYQALVDALNDKSIVFPEEVLLLFVDKHSWITCNSVIVLAFSRDELSPDSRRKLHCRMRGVANTWRYDIGIAFYSHANTPVDLVKEARAWEENAIYFNQSLDGCLRMRGDATPVNEVIKQ